ncbi:MAG TPA: serine protein kinase RIO [Candidatus Nanoarchaeia archaeon]|nr:serine protein kinase RIO [Candidatus Nanoarchaeia archaeon]
MAKITRERFDTRNDVFDQFTHRNLFKLSSQGHFVELQSPISIGKEANLFTASTKGRPVVVKIYRLQTADFNRMYEYLRTDPRFLNTKRQRRQVIFSWCKREYRNLFKARAAGVRVPTPHAFLHNILVMEHIGEYEPAPKVKDQFPLDPQDFCQKITLAVQKLYRAGLAHGDLSMFNILNDREEPVLIDFSQCTPLSDPNAAKLLQRDAKNLTTLYTKIGVPTTAAQLQAIIEKKE